MDARFDRVLPVTFFRGNTGVPLSNSKEPPIMKYYCIIVTTSECARTYDWFCADLRHSDLTRLAKVKRQIILSGDPIGGIFVQEHFVLR
jgi:hypothetical protein